MSEGLRKAYEITEAKIQFVSLVDKAANLRTFLLKKADDGKATFTTCGRIIKADPESHHVTGVVYEPMTEDSQGNYMTETEITKAAYWFTKNSGQVDIQHSFKPFEGGAIVESWVAKADFTIDEEPVKKGTWLMTVEVTDPEIWESIEKREITGFSMGGIGNYSEKDVDLDTVNKQGGGLGIEKGAVADLYAQRTQGTLFWEAFYALQDTLTHYDPISGRCVYESDETKLHECLEEFNSIVTEILSSAGSIAKALSESRPVEKAGKKMSGKNKETLSGIYESLGAFLKEFDDPEPEPNGETKKDKEDKEVNKSEVQQIVDEAVAKALAGQSQNTPQTGATPATSVAKAEAGQEPAGETITQETISKMVAEAVQKATVPKEEPVTLQQIQEMISASVSKALDPLLKSRGLPSNLGTGTGTVEKQEQHFLHGIL
ncbi:MAG: hypothetical protein K2O18_13635 [Oscillospiraceae bacterium]|nr:hypothetical protein [Oscillospiraceae bacterium]